MTRLRTLAELVRHLARRVPVVLREGRAPRRAEDLLARLRGAATYAAHRAGGPRLEPGRLALLGPRRPGTRRALFLSHTLNLEGAPIFLLLLARGLRRAGWEIAVHAPADGALRHRLEAEATPVVVGDPLLGLKDARRYGSAMATIAAAVREGGFDLVLANTLRSFWGVAVARAAGVPAAWAIHESVDWRRYFDYLPAALRPEARACLGLADRLVFASDATRRLYADLGAPGHSERIHYGLDGVAIDAFCEQRASAEARAIHGVPASARVVTVVGTTCERKGQLDFLRMARMLDQSRGAGLRFYVVGTRPSEYLTRLERFAREARLDAVVFVKETPEVYDYFRMSDVFVCSSYEESFPIVVLEAMAFGLPIVSTDVFGIPEALTDGRTGLLVRAGDPAALAAGVGRLLDDPALAGRLAAEARATFARRFTLPVMTEAWDRLFGECLAR